jgi:4-diphosphocytidyl-2-C-methyl-D-erythritol kinase
LAPEIVDVLRALGDARFARMSGSGATCFALFDSEADRDRIAGRIRTDHPGWWCLETRLR